MIDSKDSKIRKRDYDVIEMKSEIYEISTMFKHMMIKNKYSSQNSTDSPKVKDPDTTVTANKNLPACGILNMI